MTSGQTLEESKKTHAAGCFRQILPNPYVTYANLNNRLNSGRRALLECTRALSQSQLAASVQFYRKMRIYDAPPAFDTAFDAAYCGAVTSYSMILYPDVISQSIPVLPIIQKTPGEARYLRGAFRNDTARQLTRGLVAHGWGLKYSGDDETHELDEVVNDFKNSRARMRIIYVNLAIDTGQQAAYLHRILMILYKQFGTPSDQAHISYLDPNAERLQSVEQAISEAAARMGLVFNPPFNKQEEEKVRKWVLRDARFASKLDRGGYCIIRAAIYAELLARFESSYPKDRPLPLFPDVILHVVRQIPGTYDLHKKLILDYFFSRLLEVHALIAHLNPEAHREIHDQTARYIARMDSRRFIRSIKHRVHGGAFRRLMHSILDLAYVPRDVKEYMPVSFLNTKFLLRGNSRH